MLRQSKKLPDEPGEWTKKYITREYEDPYGCFLLLADVLREQFEVIDIPNFHHGLESRIDSVRERGAFISKALAGRCVGVDEEGLEEGDIVVLQCQDYPIHVGILVARNWVLHCDDGTNTTLERLNSMRWKNRIFGYFRVIV